MPLKKLFFAICLLHLAATAKAVDSPIETAGLSAKTPSSIPELLAGLRAYTVQGLFTDDEFFSPDNVQYFLGGTLGPWTDFARPTGERSKWAPIRNFDSLSSKPNLPCHVTGGRAWIIFYGEQKQLNSLTLGFDSACTIKLNDLEQWFGKAWKRGMPLPSLHPSADRMQDDGGIEFPLSPTADMSFMFNGGAMVSATFREIHPRQAPH